MTCRSTTRRIALSFTEVSAGYIGNRAAVDNSSSGVHDMVHFAQKDHLSRANLLLLLLLLSAFSHQGSPQRIFLLQLFLSTVSSSVTSTSAMSSFTTSINLLFGLPRFLFPGNSILSISSPNISIIFPP